MSVICIIPARGGSKRIPRKNIRPFAGRPMIGYAIDCARQSGVFDRVIVSTDDMEIATVAKDQGAEVPFIRPSELADDHTSTMPVIRHAIEFMSDYDKRPEWVCCLYPTAPLLAPETLTQTMAYLKRPASKDLVFSAATYSHPIQRSLRQYSDGSVEPMFPSQMKSRSQDLESAIHDAGQFYFGKTRRFLDGPGVFSRHSYAMVLPRERVVDIDTEEDWSLAERLYQSRSA